MYYVKCVVVGDGLVGKSCLLMNYKLIPDPEEYLYPNFKTDHYDLRLDGKDISLDLVDTPGQEDYVRMRALTYTEADVVIICFSLVNPWSYENVEETWVPEVRHHCPNTPIILVGTMLNLRDGLEPKKIFPICSWKRNSPISYEQGSSMAKKIGAVKYFECSNRGFPLVVTSAIRAGLNNRYKSRKCVKAKRIEKQKCVVM